MAKKQSNKRRSTKCQECGKSFAGPRYLKQHIQSQHNNNNNNNNELVQEDKITCNKCKKAISKSHIARHKVRCGAILKRKEEIKNKKSFIYFINFIIKLIMIYNKKVEIANIIGDEYDQRRHLYNEKEEIIEDDENSSRLPAPSKEENNSPMPSDSENENNNNNNDDENENIDILAKYFNSIKKEGIKEDKKALRKYFEIKNTKIKHNKIKILTKNKKIEMIKKINNNNNNNDLKFNDGNSDLFLEYINKFVFTKISCRQVIRNATEDENIIKKADQIIIKKINDYPMDEEIRKKDKEILVSKNQK